MHPYATEDARVSEKRICQVKKREARKLRPPSQWVIEDANRLIDIHELAALSGAGGISTVYDWIAAGILPKGIKITPGSVRWRYGDVITALADLANQKSAA